MVRHAPGERLWGHICQGAWQQDRMDVLGCVREGRGEMQGEL